MSKFDNEKDDRLVELYLENKEHLERLGNASHLNIKRRAAWNRIAESINNEYRTNFTWEQCKKRWQNIKFIAKSSKAANKRSSRQTGGDITNSEASKRIIDFIGETADFQDFHCEPKLTKIMKNSKISDDDLRQKQMEVLNGQLNEFKKSAALRAKQLQLVETQLATTRLFMELMESLRNSGFDQSSTFEFPEDSEQ